MKSIPSNYFFYLNTENHGMVHYLPLLENSHIFNTFIITEAITTMKFVHSNSNVGTFGTIA